MEIKYFNQDGTEQRVDIPDEGPVPPPPVFSEVPPPNMKNIWISGMIVIWVPLIIIGTIIWAVSRNVC